MIAATGWDLFKEVHPAKLPAPLALPPRMWS
jgi:hypothetical protein